MTSLPDAPSQTIAEALDTLDAAAKHLTQGAIAVGFPRSIHLIDVHLPNRAVTLGRLLTAGGQLLGIVGSRSTPAGGDPYYSFFPQWAACPQVKEQLRTLAKHLPRGVPKSYVLVPGAPAFREPWTGSTEELLDQAELAALPLDQPRMVFAMDDGPELLALGSSSLGQRAEEFLAAGATPVGLVGYRDTQGDGEATEVSVVFRQFAKSPWALQYLDSVLEVLRRLRWASGGDRRLVPPSERPASPRTSRELLAVLDTVARNLHDAALVVILDHGADTIIFDDPCRATLLDQLLTAGGTPVGITGHVVEHGARQARYRLFPEYEQEPWALAYLQGLADRLQAHLDTLSAASPRVPACPA